MVVFTPEKIEKMEGEKSQVSSKSEAARRIGSLILKPAARADFAREFFRGMKYLLRGTRAVFSFRQDLWLWALIPVAIYIFLYVATFLVVVFSLDDILERMLPSTEGSVLWKSVLVFLWIFMCAAVILLGYFLFVPVVTVISSPFNDVLSEKVELLLTGREPPPLRFKVFMKELVRIVSIEVVKLVVFVFVMAPLVILSFVIPVAGPVILFVLGGFITSLFIAYEHLDRCFSRHGLRLSERAGFIKRFFFRSMGLGTAGFLLLLIPGAVFFVMPAAAAGGCMLYVESAEA